MSKEIEGTRPGPDDTSGKAAASIAEYELHTLGWHAFQQLCLSIMREVLGQTVASFLDSRDGGRDGAFEGTWTAAPGGEVSGAFVVQCKFTSKPNSQLSPVDVQEELQKASRLATSGRCDHYVLMTNAGVSGILEEQLAARFKAVGVKHFFCFGYTWICQTIRENKRLRMLVPRVYGLGDLGQILDVRAYEQARALLESLQDDLAKVVLTATYHRAATMLEKHSFVLLLGEPAAGKSTIAATLSMAAIDQWGCSTLKLDDPSEVVRHWNPLEPSQFFWIDDAFGVTQYEPQLTYNWNRIFPKVNAALRRGAKIVMTSRDYLYNRARSDLKQDAFPLLREGEVVINVHDLTLEEKRQILYNHLKLGTQPREFRRSIKPWLEMVAQNPHFIPEIARRLSNPTFTRTLAISQPAIIEFVEHPREFLHGILTSLDVHNRAALGLIYMAGGFLQSPLNLASTQQDALARLGSKLADVTAALTSLRESLVRHVTRDGRQGWIFKHPTIGDAFSEIVLHDPELMNIYLLGAPVQELAHQVTCGDVGIQGAVVVPSDLFPIVLTRLLDPAGASLDEDLVDVFLTYRCDSDFLKMFVAACPSVYERLHDPGLRLNAVSEVPLAIRLNEAGLLPEPHRRAFARYVIEYAVDGEDTLVLTNKKLRNLLTSDEDKALVSRLRVELIPNLDRVRRTWEYNYDSDWDPAEYMADFIEALDACRTELSKDLSACRKVDTAKDRVEEWIADRQADYEETPRRGKLSRKEDVLPNLKGSRSIFDDVDS